LTIDGLAEGAESWQCHKAGISGYPEEIWYFGLLDKCYSSDRRLSSLPGSIRTEKRMVRLLTSFFQAFGAQSTRYVLIHSCLDVPTLCPENHGIIRVIDPLPSWQRA